MKVKKNFRNLLKIAILSAFVVYSSCSEEDTTLSEENIALSDESLSGKEVSPENNTLARATNCTSGKSNSNRYVSGPSNSVLPGRIDDTTCFADYEEKSVNNRTTGIFKIKEGSEHIKQNGRQPRIEKALSRLNGQKAWTYQELKGYVTIKRAGYDANTSKPNSDFSNNSGTYILQVKGAHKNDTGDPAICLFLAKPKVNSRGWQTGYEIFREQITVRGGSDANGRELIKIADVPRNSRISFECKAGFRRNSRTRALEHYVRTKINGDTKTWVIPDASSAENTVIRYGAYRCKKGQADIQWDTVTTRTKS